MYNERKWAAQSELRRVRAEKVAVEEKEGVLRLLLKVCVVRETTQVKKYAKIIP